MHVGLGHPRIEVEPGGGGQWLHSVADHVGGARAESGVHNGSVAGLLDDHGSGPATDRTPTADEWRSSFPEARSDPHSVQHVSYVSDALRNEHRLASTRYEFTDRAGVLDTDDVGRTVHSDSVITEISPPENRPRAVSEQIAAGGDDRLPGDHGGHLQATANGGSPFGLNVVAQDGRAVNQGAFARVENDVRRLLQADPDVPVRMRTEVFYSPSSLRPEAFRVTWGRLGDQPQSIFIPNDGTRIRVPRTAVR
jgi:hypothetical protein